MPLTRYEALSLTLGNVSHNASYKEHDREGQAQHIMKILVVHGVPEEDPSDVAIVIEGTLRTKTSPAFPQFRALSLVQQRNVIQKCLQEPSPDA
ncbi:hypothetical protein SRHO_G00007030 [Serrasalmus rhombeus]